MKIKAKGKKFGKKITVEFEPGKILFNGEKDDVLEDEFFYLLKNPKPVGGTYYPTVDSHLNAYNILQYYFFDDVAEDLIIDGELEPIPCEEGKIY